MNLQAVFGGLMGVGGMITLVSSVFYWVMICVKQRKGGKGEKTPFQTVVISFLLACEVGNILSSFLNFGVNSSPSLLFLCSLGQALFYLFSYSSFFLSSLLVFSLLHLAFIGKSLNPPSFVLSSTPSTKNVCLTSFFFEGLAVLFTVITIFVADGMDPCNISKATRGIYWTTWGVTSFFNFIALGFVIYNVHKITKKMSKDRRAVRSVLAVTIVVGVLRIPSFLQILLTGRNPTEIMEEGATPLSILTVIGYFLTVLQGFFIVVSVGFNQGFFSCCCGEKFKGTSSNPEPSRESQTMDSKMKTVGREKIAHEQFSVDNLRCEVE